MNGPRIPDETRQKAISRAETALEGVFPFITTDDAQIAVDAVIAVLWPKLLADAHDRTASLISAARAYLEAEAHKTPAENIAVKRRQLKRALGRLEES